MTRSPRLSLHLPADLVSRLDECARAAGRTRTEEIRRRLEGSFAPEANPVSPWDVTWRPLDAQINWTRTERPAPWLREAVERAEPWTPPVGVVVLDEPPDPDLYTRTAERAATLTRSEKT